MILVELLAGPSCGSLPAVQEVFTRWRPGNRGAREKPEPFCPWTMLPSGAGQIPRPRTARGYSFFEWASPGRRSTHSHGLPAGGVDWRGRGSQWEAASSLSASVFAGCRCAARRGGGGRYLGSLPRAVGEGLSVSIKASNTWTPQGTQGERAAAAPARRPLSAAPPPPSHRPISSRTIWIPPGASTAPASSTGPRRRGAHCARGLRLRRGGLTALSWCRSPCCGRGGGGVRARAAFADQEGHRARGPSSPDTRAARRHASSEDGGGGLYLDLPPPPPVTTPPPPRPPCPRVVVVSVGGVSLDLRGHRT